MPGGAECPRMGLLSFSVPRGKARAGRRASRTEQVVLRVDMVANTMVPQGHKEICVSY
jgi:hypothetical protein